MLNVNNQVIKNIKGGDGYSANPFQPIGGRMSYPRYSNNYRPVFWGELLQNGGHSDSNCECTKSSKEQNIFSLIKQNGGNPAITQVNAINEVSQLLAPCTHPLHAETGRRYFSTMLIPGLMICKQVERWCDECHC